MSQQLVFDGLLLSTAKLDVFSWHLNCCILSLMARLLVLSILLIFSQMSFANTEACHYWVHEKPSAGMKGLVISYKNESFPSEEYKERLQSLATKTLDKLAGVLPKDIQAAICNSNIRIEFYHIGGGGMASSTFNKYGEFERIIRMGTSEIFDGISYSSRIRGKEKMLLGVPEDETFDEHPLITFESDFLEEHELHFSYVFLHEFGHHLVFEKKPDVDSSCTTRCHNKIDDTEILNSAWESLISTSKNSDSSCYTYNGRAFYVGKCSSQEEVTTIYSDLLKSGFPSLYSTYSRAEFVAELFVIDTFHRMKLGKIFYDLSHLPKDLKTYFCPTASGDSQCEAYGTWTESNGFANFEDAKEFLKMRATVLANQ